MPVFLPFRVEYSREKDRCNKCFWQEIPKGTLQIGFMQQSMGDDCLKPQWYEMHCFFEIRRPISIDVIDGFANLRYSDQMQILPHLGVNVLATDPTTEQQIERQTADFFNIYDHLINFKRKDLVAILNANNQFVPVREAEILNHLTDVICFGALEPCSVCKDGKFVMQGHVYCCTGYDSPWSTCINSVKEPKRVPVKLSNEHQELLNVVLQVRSRIFRNAIEININDFEQHSKQPLFNMEFFILGETKMPREVVEFKIQSMGGKISSKIHRYLAAVISNADEVDKSSGIIHEAFIYGVQVIADDVIDQLVTDDPIGMIVQKDLSKWGRDPYDRMPTRNRWNAANQNTPPKRNHFNFGRPAAVKMERGTVLCGTTTYEAVLNFVDISSNKNTYCVLRLLNNSNNYMVSQTTGRIGTSVKTQTSYSSLENARSAFKGIYRTKTGNAFGAEKFIKKPGLYNHVNIDNKTINKPSQTPPSKLTKPLYELMKLLYSDDTVFKSTLLAYCFDLDGMPLGQLTMVQIQAAKNLLDDMSKWQISENSNQMITASNRFYSYFPHNFDHRRPPVFSTQNMIQEKINMLEHLLQQGHKYESLTNKLNREKNIFDFCYEHLQDSAEITMLNKASGMYAQICDYVKNTRLQNSDAFEVDEVFEVLRHDELIRYQVHEKNFNRQLLFHGTRTENLVGILTDGLKISPPEAIFCGSIFGRGIYFSDSVSKSAAYCRSGHSGFGLVLLCEVAAGLTDVRYKYDTSKLIDYCESVQALGQNYPHPLHIRPDGLKIPNGPLVQRNENTGITFNEFVVSDESRVKIRYLIKLKFNNVLNVLPTIGSLSNMVAGRIPSSVYNLPKSKP